jgi:CBS domain-containing protein
MRHLARHTSGRLHSLPKAIAAREALIAAAYRELPNRRSRGNIARRPVPGDTPSPLRSGRPVGLEREIMNYLDVMSEPPLVLQRDDSVADALKRMLDQRLTSAPVVDGKDRFVGMFRVRRVVGLALPKAATLDKLVDDISFLNESLDDLKRRLGAVAKDAVGRHLDDTVPVVTPKMALAEILLLLYRSSNTLPVVEQPSRKLLGIVTSQRILNSLLGNA